MNKISLKNILKKTLKKKKSKSDYHERLSAIKEKHTNAYEPWSTAQDEKLLKLYKKNVPEIALSKIFKRQTSAIRSRIMKLLDK